MNDSMVSRVSKTIVICLLISVTAGCSVAGKQPSSWVSSTTSEVVFIQWTEATGNLSGSLQTADLNSDTSGDPVKTNTASITGVISNGNITINADGSTLTGKIDNSHLVLNIASGSEIIPLSFDPGTPNDFNRGVSTLTQIFMKNRVAADQIQTDNAFSTEIANLPAAEDSVKAAVQKVITSLTKLNSAATNLLQYSKVLLSGSCENFDKSSKIFDLNSNVFSTLSDLDYDITSLNSAKSDLHNIDLYFATESSVFSKGLVTKSALAAIAQGQKVEDSTNSLSATAGATRDKTSNSTDAAMSKVDAMSSC